MIHRNFKNFKFKRTYIGGSKQRELEIFTEVQGTKEDNSECDWLEYRRIFTQYSNDILNIILSWRFITFRLSFVFLALSVMFFFVNSYASLLIFIMSISFHLTFLYLIKREQKNLSAFNFSFDVILCEIKKQTGFVFDKN